MDFQNTEVGHYPLTLVNPDGTLAPVPAGDVFTAVSSSASLGVAVAPDAAGNQELVVTPLVLQSDTANGGGGITVTVTDSAGDVAADLTGTDSINIVTVPVHAQITLGAPTRTTQAAPTAPGP